MSIDYIVLAISALLGIGGGLYALYATRDYRPQHRCKKHQDTVHHQPVTH